MSATAVTSERDRTTAESVRPSAWRMARINFLLGGLVFVAWLLLGGERALQAVANHWQVSLTMVFGSLVGGGTSEGGGAVAFPVMTKVLAVPAPQARLFTFAIQSVGMGAATATIILNRVPVEWKAIRNGAPWAVLGVVISSLVLAPRLDPPTVRLVFTAILASLAMALWISRRLAPGRRDWLEAVGPFERSVLFGAGLAGGMLSGVAGLGENTIMFSLLVLGFRISERVVTPTTVILLTIVSWTGFATHVFLMDDFKGQVVDMWLAAAPIVAIGAPTGALICTRMSRDAIVRLLYFLISVEFVSTLLLVPMTGDRAIVFGLSIALFSLVCVWLATHPRYHVPVEQDPGAGVGNRRAAGYSSSEVGDAKREAKVANRTITVRGTAYPVILPNIRDPRLGIAAVVLSLQALGQVGLHWPISIPQILVAILICAVIEMVVVFRRSKSIVWPASALLTGSGVALIMRVVGTPPDQPWATNGLLLFAGVAAFSLGQKYVLRYHGKNLFNPSNVGLVLAFLIFGNSRLEPLNLWWAPLNAWMIAAYAIILVGGTYVVWRAKALTMSLTFFGSFAVFQGILSASGHCMTANWAFAPVCGGDYYRTVVTSPELLIYAYFMVTDPPTVPAARVARVAFAIVAGISTTVLMAAQTNEFGTKVALLGGLTILLLAHPVFDRLLPEKGSAEDTIRAFGNRLVTGGAGAAGVLRPLARVGAMALVVAVVGAGVVAAGTPARVAAAPDMTEVFNGSTYQIDPSTLPPITVNQSVKDWDHEIAASAPDLLVILAQNLQVEDQALLKSDANLLTAVDHGDRLDQLRARVQADIAAGTCIVDVYKFDSVNVTLIVPFGVQTGLSLGFDAKGTVTHQTYDSASGNLIKTESSPFAQTFAIRRATGTRWLNVAVLPAGTGE